MTCEDAQELITALVDNELSDTERSSIEDHFRVCRNCAFAYEQERALKREVRLAVASLRAPAHLRERILSDRRILPERAESRKRWKDRWPATGTFLRPAFALALLVLVILPVLYLVRPAQQSVSLSTLKTHKKIVDGSISFAKARSQEEIKERLSRSVEGKFAPMGHDLSMASLRAVGGFVHEVAGRKILVTIYDGRGSPLTCHIFLGTEEGGVPTNAAVFFDPEKGINLYAFSRGRINGVMQREGEATCVLVSERPMTDLLALARSKA